jgi:hypothetical protein
MFQVALPGLAERQAQKDMRTHLIHRSARDIIPPLGGTPASCYLFASHPVCSMAAQRGLYFWSFGTATTRIVPLHFIIQPSPRSFPLFQHLHHTRYFRKVVGDVRGGPTY